MAMKFLQNCGRNFSSKISVGKKPDSNGILQELCHVSQKQIQLILPTGKVEISADFFEFLSEKMGGNGIL